MLESQLDIFYQLKKDDIVNAEQIEKDEKRKS